MKKIISFTIDGIISGIVLCIVCAASISVESEAIGAFLFSLGLFSMICFRFGLYTGKTIYIVTRPRSYIKEVMITLFGNAVGTAIGGLLLNLTRFGNTFSQAATETIGAKFADNPLSMFVLAVFCGILIFIAVEGYRKCTENNNHTGALFVVVLPIMVFILCGFNHSIADFAFFFISRCAYANGFVLYFIMVITGNAAGCMLIPFMKKFSIDSL